MQLDRDLQHLGVRAFKVSEHRIALANRNWSPWAVCRPCQQPGINDVCEDRKGRISCQNKIHPPWPAGPFILIFGEMRWASRERRWDAARGAVWRRQSLLYEPDANQTAARSWHCAVAPTLMTMIVLPQSFAGDQTWLRYTTLRDVRRRTPSSSTSAGVFPTLPRLQISPATQYSAEFGV